MIIQKLTTTLLVVFLVFIFSSGQKVNNNEVAERNSIKNNELENETLKNEERIEFDTTFKIKDHSFRFSIQDLNEHEFRLIFIKDKNEIKADTLPSDGLGNIEFIDFNKDNYIDILLSYIGSNAVKKLYLFDQVNDEFKLLEGFDRFPSAIQLKKNKNYYYSYHRAGCADMNWVSDLFYIDNFKTIHLGHIYGKGCENETAINPASIEVYKVMENKESNMKLIEILPYVKHIPNFDMKWTFIEEYWNKNYLKYQ
ncbi:MAG: hypothetical protein ACOVP1_09120 [Bacteroidia bacterium]